MDLAERVSTLRRANGLSARQLAALAGVAPTTVTRIECGAVSPSFDLAREILTVLGAPIGIDEVADTATIAGARLALDPSLDIDVTDGVRAWRRRWARIGLVDHSGAVLASRCADLLFRAATTARLTRRPGAGDFHPDRSALDLAMSFRDRGVAYAMTGDAAANLYSDSAGEMWPVLYVVDVAQAAAAAGLSRREPGTFGARTTLIPFDGVSEVGRIEIDGASVAALDQVALDCFAGTGRMAEQADILLGRRAA